MADDHVQAKVILKTGTTLHVIFGRGRTFTAHSFTGATIHALVGLNGNTYFVQGDSIDYIEMGK